MPKGGEEFWADAVNIEVVGVVGGETSSELVQAAGDLAHIEAKADSDDNIRAVLKADSVGSLEALRQAYRILAPGGVLLCTLPTVSRISFEDRGLDGDFWRFTEFPENDMFLIVVEVLSDKGIAIDHPSS